MRPIDRIRISIQKDVEESQIWKTPLDTVHQDRLDLCDAVERLRGLLLRLADGWSQYVKHSGASGSVESMALAWGQMKSLTQEARKASGEPDPLAE